jgi:hypothetical protein
MNYPFIRLAEATEHGGPGMSSADQGLVSLLLLKERIT